MKNIYSIKEARRLLCPKRLSHNHVLPKLSLRHRLFSIVLVLTASAALSSCEQLDTLFVKSKKSGIGKVSEKLLSHQQTPLNSVRVASNNPAIISDGLQVGETAVDLSKTFSCTAKNEPSFSLSGEGKGSFELTAGSIRLIKTHNSNLSAQLHVTCPTTSSHTKETLSLLLKSLQTNKVSSVLPQTQTTFKVNVEPFFLPALFSCTDKKHAPNFSLEDDRTNAFLLKENTIQIQPSASTDSTATLSITCPETKGFEQHTLRYALNDGRSKQQQALYQCTQEGFGLEFTNHNNTKLEDGVYKHYLGTMRAEALPIIVSLTSTQDSCTALTQKQLQEYLGNFGSFSYQSEDTTLAQVTPKGVVYPLPASLLDDTKATITLTYASTELGKASGSYAIKVSGVNPTWAYSLRKLFASDENTYAIQIKNNKDQTVDIGFTDEGNLDVAAALTFADNGNADVVVWYDQAATKHDIVIDSTQHLFRLIDNGALVTLANSYKPAVRTQYQTSSELLNTKKLLRIETLSHSSLGLQPGVFFGYNHNSVQETQRWNMSANIPSSIATTQPVDLERFEMLYYSLTNNIPSEEQQQALEQSALTYKLKKRIPQ